MAVSAYLTGVRHAPHSYYADAAQPEAEMHRRALILLISTWATIIVILAVVAIFYLWIAVALLALQIVAMALSIGRSLRGARKLLREEALHALTERTQPRLHALAVDVAQRMDIPLPPLYMLETPIVNAFAMPVSLRRRVVVLHSGLTEVCTPDMLRAVIAHEFAHIRNGDLAVLTLMQETDTILRRVSAQVVGRNATSSYARAPWRKSNIGQDILAVLFGIIGKLLIALSMLGALIMRGASRSREHLADLTAARALGGAHSMVEVLQLFQDMHGPQGDGSRQYDLWLTHPRPTKRIGFLIKTCGRQASQLSP